MKYRGRFAPSPTGSLHFGSLVAAVGSYLDAKHHEGEWLIRMEDLDPPRVANGSADSILRALERYGMEWDSDILYQSHRQSAYREALAELGDKAFTFPCYCSRKQIAELGQAGSEGVIYPGTCRTAKQENQHSQQHSIRLKTDSSKTSFNDRLCGQVTQNIAKEIGDFVIRRSDGLFAYQLAVVVDDEYQDITHIVRGADLLLSTPRQIYLQQLLEFRTPVYAHLPLVLDQTGRKLSKSDNDHPIDEMRPVETLLACLTYLNQSLPEELPGNLDELWQWAIRAWDSSKIAKTPEARVSTRA